MKVALDAEPFPVLEFLIDIGAMSRDDIARCNRWAFEASFFQKSALNDGNE